MRPAYRPIQLDAAFSYESAAVNAVRATLTTTHGDAFAAAFVAEHKQDILRTARTRLCGSSGAVVAAEAIRLGDVGNGV